MVLPALLCGCAAVLNPTASAHQAITVTTVPAGADCLLENDKGKYTLTTPGTVTVAKTDWPGVLGNKLSVTCRKGALSASDSFSSMPSGWGWLSGAGGGVSAFADRQTGYAYPSTITLDLK